MEIINVIAVSTKKERGWIKCAPISGNGVWSDSGMHFDKNRFDFAGSGLYEVDYVNNASLGGTDLEITKATKIIDFVDVADEFLEGNDNEKML